MGELLYLYLEENNMLEEIANSLVVERNVTLISKKKSNEVAYFEGSRYFDEKDFRKYVPCFEYTYAVNTRFSMNNEVIFSYLDTKRGVSVEEERPIDVYGSENTTRKYYNAEGREVILYQKRENDNGKVDYKMKHVCYNGESKEKAFRLPCSLKALLSNEENFATIICNMYNIDLYDYHSELIRREQILNKIRLIDKELIRLEKLRNSYLNELEYGENKKTK